ncbi:MAG TPA: hypothetical protein VFC99_15015 [Acidimicrobiia bacterium]|nr:hypothetical protein [Acidimicrobiia bacterium]
MSEVQDAATSFVVERFNSMLEADGARIDVVGTEGDTLTVRYVAGAAGGCEACVLDPDDLESLVGEALQRQGSPLRRVTVLR